MKKIIFCFLIVSACQVEKDENRLKLALNQLLLDWHQAAADANGDQFFGLMDDDCIYIGTDQTEKWTKTEFMSFAKPYFDRGSAWDFKTINREIYLNNNNTSAWFDEQLDTWMGVCQASGVLEQNESGDWKIKHYQLSVTIDNDKIKQFIELSK